MDWFLKIKPVLIDERGRDYLKDEKAIYLFQSYYLGLCCAWDIYFIRNYNEENGNIWIGKKQFSFKNMSLLKLGEYNFLCDVENLEETKVWLEENIRGKWKRRQMLKEFQKYPYERG